MNLTPESDIPEVVKAEVAATKKAERLRKRSRVLSVWGIVFLWLPFVLPLVFFVRGAFSGHPLPVLIYPYLVLVFRPFSNIGGLLLYLASRAADYLRKPIGWLALSLPILSVASNVIFGGFLYRYDYTNLTKPAGIVILICLMVALLCMLALCVFSILLIKKVFPQKPKPDATA